MPTKQNSKNLVFTQTWQSEVNLNECEGRERNFAVTNSDAKYP